MTDVLANPTLANDLTLPPQARTVLRHLARGRSITALEALGVYRIFRLAARILELRDAGHDVITDMKQDETGKWYGEYRLNGI